VLLDPLGETARSLDAELNADQRRRLLRISPATGLVALNALEGVGAGGSGTLGGERRLNDLVHALRRVRAGRYLDSGYWGPRLEEMVTRALRAAASLPGGTLVDAHTLLSTGGRVGRGVPAEAQEPVRELADRVRDRPEDADGARRLLHEVVRSPVLSRLLASREPTLHPADLVAPGRIVLVSGDASDIGESTARYLLSTLLALVWAELLARPTGPKTFVLLDEAQWFAHEGLGEMLRLARRQNVHVVVATQAIGSLPEPVQEAVWTNVADFVAFRGSPSEAREFARLVRGVSAEDVLALPRGEAIALVGKGGAAEWIRTAWLPGDVREPPPPEAAPGGDPRGRVLDELRRRTAGAEGEFRVSLDELRARVDPVGDVVRRVGSELSRSGALVRVERGGQGSLWVLRADRLRAWAGEPAPTGPPGASPPSQPS
jgi:hypothetical protein